MPDLSLDPGDAAELAGMLQFLSEWLTADRTTLSASLTRFTGHPGYDLTQLRNDLNRFTFLLGGSDGEDLFQPGQP